MLPQFSSSFHLSALLSFASSAAESPEVPSDGAAKEVGEKGGVDSLVASMEKVAIKEDAPAGSSAAASSRTPSKEASEGSSG
jgi:hypothetical protein